ncbi:hypothetical protein SteCoe_29872 [Stentor coeruleus]|uniref:Uncharacterized protein n=1 Tax=Stentor coeruleus TaxID=5963 RepID=A0A1R2B4U7_9CILI|nr:hypothetical protein SteCoe_29872 [Stentor coeruleus]
MKLGVLFEGLPAKNKTWLLISLGYTTVIGYLAFSNYRQEKRQEYLDFVKLYRGQGHYQHPWVKNPTQVPEHVKKTDYTKIIENPKGNRYL